MDKSIVQKSKTDYLTKAIMVCIGIIWLVMKYVGDATSPEMLILFGAKFNPLITDGEYWRLLTSMFIHIGIIHLFFNLYALFILGKSVECFFGKIDFLVIYFISGLWGSLFSYAFNNSISAGASGAVFGLIGALISFFAINREMFGESGKKTLISTIFIAVLNLVIGFSTSGIDNYAHIGGLLGGLSLGVGLTPRYKFDFDKGIYDSFKIQGLSRTLLIGSIYFLFFVSALAVAVNENKDSDEFLKFKGKYLTGNENWVLSKSNEQWF
ncbi:MAG: rhomboid family intramembrane serine protease [Calditrichaeota bacterium]|nr:MAG: rhomboid family intramembrane serine protease [Calditrichota bacterium]